ncbi:LacI family DNA-binding transcriptional regulator [Amycolatopsis sp. NPDC049253]|uniref:LacI family DNA-binding transcriptional regulator n=1 Tax=Amycolatopsis sp. NPDC049253 TaxID=3155274 RepID=UPI00342705F7
MARIEDVAKRAGVSISTASRALNGHPRISPNTARRVTEAAQSLGYVASSSAYTLATGRNRNVGVVLPYIERWYFGTVLAGIESRLMRAGYDLSLYDFNGSAEQRASVFTDFLLRKHVDALITVAVRLEPHELEVLHRLDKPVLAVGGPVPGAATLRIDDFGAAKLATLHLISLGHRRIGLIGGDTASEMDFRQPETRHGGYLEAMAESGLPVSDTWFFPADFTIAGGYAAAKTALSDPRLSVSALFAASDEMAIGAVLAAKDLGMKVPEDVSIVGIDGHDLSEFFGLTTVAQSPRDQGARAAELILGVLSGDQPASPTDTLWPIELIVRSSTTRYHAP